ncbi:MAG: DUF177 domain-containing protein [Chromatiales bacterium]|nr:DUF177 domain-containing protein [Chromatiales bacterium]
MVERLPLVVWYKALAKNKAFISGRLTVKKLPKLSQLCPSCHSSIEALLGFEWSFAYDCVLLTMEVDATLDLECQRCLNQMQWGIQLQNQLCIVDSNAKAGQLPHNTDYYVCASDKMAIADLIEDELLLVIPQNPMHNSRDECNADFISYLNRYRHRSQKDESPFKVLEGNIETAE